MEPAIPRVSPPGPWVLNFPSYCARVRDNAGKSIMCTHQPFPWHIGSGGSGCARWRCWETDRHAAVCSIRTGISFLTKQTKESTADILNKHVFTAVNAVILSILAMSLIVSGHLIWLVERNHNAGMFPRSYLDGVDDGIWWSLVTMTTVRKPLPAAVPSASAATLTHPCALLLN